MRKSSERRPLGEISGKLRIEFLRKYGEESRH